MSAHLADADYKYTHLVPNIGEKYGNGIGQLSSIDSNQGAHLCMPL